ncbi:MAG: polysaccharide deacetylase [Ramlibacter sp.]|nr:polysaccharide deacetylase [Ramlibacter sp.]
MSAVLTRPGLSRWPVPPLLWATAGIHVGAAIALLAVPAQWPWILAVVVLNNAVVTGIGLWPRSTALGDNLLRLPAAAVARREVALTIDDGPEPEVTPAVLDLLDAAGARATFFCIAAHVQRHPELVREIVRRGHSVQNHSHVHSHRFSLLGPRGLAREIQAAQAVLSDVTGEVPGFFRAPAGLRNPFLAPVLHRMGLALASWTRRGFDTRERDPQRVLQRLTKGLAAGDILLLHDGNCARDAQDRPVVLTVLPALLAELRRQRLVPVTLPQALSTPRSPAP